MPRSLNTLPVVVRCPDGLVALPDADLLEDIVSAAAAERPERARVLANRPDAELEVAVTERAASVWIDHQLIARLPNEADR